MRQYDVYLTRDESTCMSIKLKRLSFHSKEFTSKGRQSVSVIIGDHRHRPSLYFLLNRENIFHDAMTANTRSCTYVTYNYECVYETRVDTSRAAPRRV